MNRVLAARSLKFSEHRGNETSWSSMGDPSRNEVFVHKKSEINKNKGEGGKLRTAFSTNAQSQDKLKTPSVVAALLHREAENKKKVARGVWSPLGEIYSTHGTPDLDLCDAKGNKKVKAHGGIRRNEKMRMDETKKLGNLVQLFDETKAMCAVNLFNRPGQNRIDSKEGVVRPTMEASRHPSPRNREEQNFHRTKALDTTCHRIARLGVKDEKHKRQVKKKAQDKSLEQIDHLTEGRSHHLARWRGGFEETKSAKNNVLIQHLVKRSEDRELVNVDHSLMSNAYEIACEKGLKLFPGQMDHFTIWEKARMMGTYAQNAEFKAMQNRAEEHSAMRSQHDHLGARHGRRAPRPLTGSPRADSAGNSPRLVMRTLSKSATTPVLSNPAR